MRKKTVLYMVSVLVLLLILTGCASKPVTGTSFIGTVLENTGEYLLVEPVAGSAELSSADKITIFIKEETELQVQGQTQSITIDEISVGDQVEIFYSGAIAESYPAQINSSHRVVLLKNEVFTAQNEHFLVKTYVNKLEVKEGEAISLYSTIEYIGEAEQIEIWSGDPYFHHMIYRDEEVFSGGMTLDILKKTELKKGEVYTIPFVKSGGYSEDDPDADFWKDFFAEEELKLPKGTYTFAGITAFTLDQEQQERVELKTEFVVEVK